MSRSNPFSRLAPLVGAFLLAPLALASFPSAAAAAGATISGQVIDANSRVGIAHASVRLTAVGAADSVSAQTDAGGFYAFHDLAAGTFRLAAWASAYTPQVWRGHPCYHIELCPPAPFDPVTTVAGQETAGIVFEMRGRGALTGRITSAATGAPLVGAWVIPYSPEGFLLRGAAFTGNDGVYHLDGLPEGEVIAQAFAGGYQPELYDQIDPRGGYGAATRIVIRAGEETPDIDFSLTALGRLTGRVIDRANGVGVADCKVFLRTVTALGAPVQNAPCQPDGSFAAEELWPGTYQALVVPSDTHAPYLAGFGNCNLGPFYSPICDQPASSYFTVEPRGTTDVGVLPLDEGVLLAGTVQLQTSPGGDGADGPVVRLYDAGGREVRSHRVQLWEEDYGFSFLAPGVYRLVLDGRGFYVSQAWHGSAACSRWYCDPGLAEPVQLGPGGHREDLDFFAFPLAPYTRCVASPTAICVQQGRFQLEATWRDFRGQSGAATAVRITDETAYFWFFDPANVELVVKTLDACTPELGLHFWVFASGLTNVEVELKVTDTLTGQVRTYGNPSGQVIAPILDIGAFATCTAPEAGPAGGFGEASSFAMAEPEPVAASAGEPGEGVAGALPTCSENGESVCLAGGRFETRVRYQVRAGEPTYGAHARHLTGDTAAFDFFSPDNIELTVKVLEACDQAIPGYWVFAAGLTDVKVEIEVTDTVTGQNVIYPGAFGPFRSIFDLGSFAASCD